MRTSIPNIRCLECGEFSVTLVKVGQPGHHGFRIFSAECESCGHDVKADMERVQEKGKGR